MLKSRASKVFPDLAVGRQDLIRYFLTKGTDLKWNHRQEPQLFLKYSYKKKIINKIMSNKILYSENVGYGFIYPCFFDNFVSLLITCITSPSTSQLAYSHLCFTQLFYYSCNLACNFKKYRYYCNKTN